ncbi:MAG: 1-(5-phosphoribosyl)-5-[(5-phosphoribosylamino)methylideneamino]imidazole-4-carboxamide isomerase [Clostridia bacterium]|nr:1-(5-phosphoribosyl)-5-[(5-phosphoribosylamino)methylideneamino]imidazole-4-carboxamide isomerase [Clostridia bacterium]
MIILPAIDLYEGKCVRLLKGDYNKKTVYSDFPEEIAKDFESRGATHIHIVDLEGAKNGTTPNLETVKRIVEATSLSAEIGGGIRSTEVIEAYVNAGVDRVILGTAAVSDKVFLKEALDAFGEKIVVGVDIKDGFVAIKGWTEKSQYRYTDFCSLMEELGVKTLICTDISKDGAMQGTNTELYKSLSASFNMNIIASGGVSSLEEVKKLAALNIYGAIIGKAYYTGAIKIEDAVSICREGRF